ncbi:MAG TPA: prepilin-type N-terminal cleavage/methylation domain-containing protein [Telluria sp.]
MKRPWLQRGLSLVELLAGLAIAAAVMAPLVQMQSTAASAAVIVRTQLEAEREADFALERIVARVRSTAPAALAANASEASSGNWFGSVTFLRVGEQLLERSGGVDQVLAESVTDFRIVALASVGAQPLVQVSLTLAHARSASNEQALALAAAGASTTAQATVRMGSAL